MSLNAWTQFDRLFDKRKLRVGTVTAHDATTDESVLDDYGGSTFRAVGTTVAIGDKAFVIDGKVDREAPALTESTVYV